MQQPALAPVPPLPPAIPGQQTYTFRPGASSPTSVYEAATAQREVLGNQLEHLQDQRSGLVERLHDGSLNAADRTGTEARLAQIDARIASVEKQIAVSDEAVAQAAAVPGAVTGHEERESAMRAARDRGDPEAPFVIAGLFIVVAILPISIAFARRLWKRTGAAVAALPSELMERMSHVDQAIEAIAIEVERIGEGQRFMTRVLTEDGRALGAGAAEPIRQAQRDAVPVRSRETER